MATATTEKFLEKARQVHGERYDYSLVGQVTCKSKVRIICKIHGEFLQRHGSHLVTNGCQECSKETKRFNYTYTTEEFIILANIKHDNFYNYNKVLYRGTKVKIVITCNIHGDFMQTASNHLQGQGCMSCAILKRGTGIRTTDEFLERAKSVHGETYNYENLVYTLSHEKVAIVCRVHGEFWQVANYHINQKCGCPQCAQTKLGWGKSAFVRGCSGGTGTLYILKCYNGSEEFYKTGITKNSVEERYNSITKMPYEYEVFLDFKNTPENVYDLEKIILRTFKKFKYSSQINFGGQTECFNLNFPAEEIKTQLLRLTK